MRALRPLIILSLTALLVLGVFPQLPIPEAEATIAVTGIHWQRTGSSWESQEIEHRVSTLGLAWDDEAPTEAWYRVKRDGRWGGWSALRISSDHGPDTLTSEGRRSRSGSDPIWVGDGEAIQFRMTGSRARNAKAVLIDTMDRRNPVARTVRDFLIPRLPKALGAPSQPFIHPRSDWDPANQCVPKDEPGLVQVTHAFVHHTVGLNSYSQGSVPSQILGICIFHTQSRGWDDIGYNFLIDRYGGIWEGRSGGIENGVQGAHAQGFNSYSMGVAFMGTHSSTPPTAAAEAALTELLAWKASIHNFEPTATTTLVSKGSNKWPEGTTVALRAISGHRDGQSTSCPGTACYNRIPTYKTAVSQQWSQIPISTYVSPLVGDFDGDNTDEAAVFRTIDGHWIVAEPTGSTSTWADFSTASGWSRQIVGDFNGDGRDDIANFHPSNGTWWVSRSTGTGFTTSLWADFTTANGWTIQLVGDFNGDGRDDITNRHVGNGTWWTILSAGSTFQSARNWGTTETEDHLSHLWIQDIDGDGRDDVLAIDAYNGFIHRHMSSGWDFDVDNIVDSPWRTTVGGADRGREGGNEGWLYFGQEFQWIRISDMDVVIPDLPAEGEDPPEATTTIVVDLPRP